jgi:hypothetical protein
MRVANEPVEDAIGQRRIADLFVPAGDRKLRSEDRGAHLVAIQVNNASLIRIKWVHPHDLDSSVQWSTDIAVARCDERLQSAAQVGAASTSFIVRPAAVYLGRPRIVSEILARHSCWIGSTPLVAQKQQIAAADVATFVESQLLSASRLVPSIVVTADRFTDRTVIDADRMQQKLQGFAQVAVLDKWASFQLTDQLGKALSCFFEYLRKSLDQRLFSFLAQLSVFRFTDGDVHKAVQATIDSERQAEAVRIRQQIEEGRTAARDARDLKDLLDLTDEENSSLTQQVAELKAETAELTARLKDVKQISL